MKFYNKGVFENKKFDLRIGDAKKHIEDYDVSKNG